MDLQDIIDRTYEGDVQAFSQLVRRYRDMAFGYALTIVDREQTAEDAVQEAMALAYINLDRLREPRAFAAWLRGIVRNQCYRALRSERATEPWESIEVDHPAQVFDKNSIWDQVMEAIQTLEPDQREMVYLHYECGLSQSEIATQLNLTVGAVNMRLHAARSRLKRRLKPMKDETSQTTNSGRIQEVRGPIVTVQFAPKATPPMLSHITGHGEDGLCVVQHLSAGRILAVASRLGSIWMPGQEVFDRGQPFFGSLSQAVVNLVLEQFRTPKSSQPLATGIKSIDVFAPLTQSGTTGIFAEWGLGVLVLLPELIHHLDNDADRHTFFVFLPPLRDDTHWKDLNAEVSVGTKSISIVYLPVADPITPEFLGSIEVLNAKLVLSRFLAEQAIWPCIDPLTSCSWRLDEMSDGGLASDVRKLLRTYFSLQFTVDDANRHTLTQSELVLIQRARKVLRYISQPFFVAEPYTSRPGAFVERTDAIQCLKEILDGRHDATHRDAFYMTGAAPKG